jgi:hypothetical protein
MDLRPYIENLHNEFAGAAEAGGPEARALADRLFTQLEAAIRLTLLDALSSAADEITRDLAPGSVHVRLRGREPAFVVTPAGREFERTDAGDRSSTAPSPLPVLPPEGDDGGTSRINLRLPDHLKASIEEAAGRAGLSVNAWLIRTLATSVESGDRDRRPARRPEPKSGQHITGWVR